jgi:hypothetical protein
MADEDTTRARAILDDAIFADHIEACLVAATGPGSPPPTVMLMAGGRRRKSSDRAVNVTCMRPSDVPDIITSLIMVLAEHADSGTPADADAALTALIGYARALREYTKTLGAEVPDLPIPERQEWGGGEPDGEPDAGKPGRESFTVDLGAWREAAIPGSPPVHATMTVQPLDPSAPVMMLQRDSTSTDICVHGKAQCVGGCEQWVWLGHWTEPRIAAAKVQPWCVECVAQAYVKGRLSEIPVLGHVLDGKPGDGHAGHTVKAGR